MSGSTNQSDSLALDTKIIGAIGTYLGTVTQLTINGTSYTPATLKAVFQAEIDADRATDAAKAMYKQQVTDAETARGNARVTRKALKGYILSTFGPKAVNVLEDFGFSAPKPLGPKTTKAKADAAGKARATKKARRDAVAAATQGTSTDGSTTGATPPPTPTTSITVASSTPITASITPVSSNTPQKS